MILDTEKFLAWRDFEIKNFQSNLKKISEKRKLEGCLALLIVLII